MWKGRATRSVVWRLLNESTPDDAEGLPIGVVIMLVGMMSWCFLALMQEIDGDPEQMLGYRATTASRSGNDIEANAVASCILSTEPGTAACCSQGPHLRNRIERFNRASTTPVSLTVTTSASGSAFVLLAGIDLIIR